MNQSFLNCATLDYTVQEAKTRDKAGREAGNEAIAAQTGCISAGTSLRTLPTAIETG